MLWLHPMGLLLVVKVRLFVGEVLLWILRRWTLLLKDDIRVRNVKRLNLPIASIMASVVAARNHDQAAVESVHHVVNLLTDLQKKRFYSAHCVATYSGPGLDILMDSTYSQNN